MYDVADPDSFAKLGEWLKTLQETAGDSLKCIMVVENKVDQLPEAGSLGSFYRPQRPSSFVQEAKVQAFCHEHGLLFARASAKMNACAFKWEGQKVGDIVSHLLLSIHASTLARGLSTTGSVASPSGAANKAAATGSTGGGSGNVVLTDTPRGKSGVVASSVDCGSCGKNTN